MRTYFFIAIAFMLWFPVVSQAQVKLTGRIVDHDKPMEFAEVVLLTTDSVALKSEFSDANGYFTLTTQPGTYLVHVRQLGKLLFRKQIEALHSTDLGTLAVESVRVLNEVVIESKKKLIERQVDRLVFNVENSLSAVGGDGLDVLQVTPLLRVQNDAISIIGKAEVNVLINDRPVPLSGQALTNYLRSIPASDIAQIEVITTPPARYDAAGNGGLINIKLKKVKKDDFSGNLSGRYRQGYYSSAGINGGLNFQKKKLTLSTSVSANNGSRRLQDENTIYYPDRTWLEEGITRHYHKDIGGRLALDYQITKKAFWGLQATADVSTPDSRTHNTVNLQEGTRRYPFLQSEAIHTKRNTSYALNAHYVLNIDTTGKKFSVDADYFTYTGHNDQDFYSWSVANIARANQSRQQADIFTSQFDVELPTAFARYSFGAKAAFVTNRSNLSAFDKLANAPVTSLSNVFTYQERVQAAYASLKKDLTQTLKLQLGLRLENTQVDTYSETMNQTNKQRYANLFPTGYLQYVPNDTHSFSWNYGRRISRPSYSQLNPFRWYTTAFAYTEGNPELRPVFGNDIEFSYSYKDFLTTTVSTFWTLDRSREITFVNADYTQVTKPLNYYNILSSDITQIYVYNKIKWLESSNSWTAYYYKVTSNLENTKPVISQYGYYLSSNNTFVLNTKKTLRMGVLLGYSSPFLDGINEIKGYVTSNISFQSILYKKKLTIAVRVEDPLRTNKIRFTAITNNIMYKQSSYFDRQSITLSVQYKFLNSKIRGKNTGNSNTSETNRLY